MRQRLFTFLAIILLVFLLVGLNAVSYVKKDVEPDREFVPNRSTFNTGATGTRAFYDLLTETGRKPARWQEDFSALTGNSKKKPQTLVIVGAPRKSYGEKELEQLLSWVSLGGRLVVIDRSPRRELISTTANWKISSEIKKFPEYRTDPSDQRQMTDKIPAGMPVQPTVLTVNVNAVQPSGFAASAGIEKIDDSAPAAPTPSVVAEDQDDEAAEPPPPIKPKPTVNQNRNAPVIKSLPTPPPVSTENAAKFPTIENPSQSAPVVHIADSSGKVLLADFPYGSGQVIFLTDPYIVSNAGIGLVDNAQLAINVVTAGGGTIAFDEFHQGYGATENEFFAYFAGTPVVAIGAQLVLLVGLLFFTQSRRFARPVPAVEPSRLSKLEYVAAMAELQQRTKAYDLAIENIYTDFRRRAARLFGAGNYEITPRELAVKIAERLKLNPDDVEKLMNKAQEIAYGEPTNKREVLDVAARLRDLEEKLNIKRTRKNLFAK